MKNLRPVERSFYSPILDLLKDFGFQGLMEIGIGQNREYVDILFSYEDIKYIAEIKVSDRTDDILDGIVQVDNYAHDFDTPNKIVICYPDNVRNPVASMEDIQKIAINRSCRIVSLTEEWHENLPSITVKSYFSTLQNLIDKKHSSILRLETASKILEESIILLSRLINAEFNDRSLFDEMLEYLTKDQGLFLSLCNVKEDDKKLRNQVIDLLAYILTNQILFYFLYSKNVTSSKRKVDEIKKVDDIRELNIYFNQIKEIDFKPIYDIDVISRIPSHSSIVECVNKIIDCLSPLKVDELKSDLFGRLIGRSMPNTTRDILASYYTKINSAEFLSRLLIQKWDEKVWDLACGSGTLLVASYNIKKELFAKEKGSITKQDAEDLHKIFLQEQITGTDIMPFACHLTGLNLSAQNLYTETDFMRVCNKNSLEIDLDNGAEVKEAYGDVSNSLANIKKQKDIFDFDDLSPKPLVCNSSKTFKLDKADTIIINPPFTQYNKIPKVIREEFFRHNFTEVAGTRIGLWAIFLLTADKLLKPNGKIGAIIHTSFLRGKFSQPIRDYFLDNYTIEYIIKPSDDSAFSEDTSITDMILIAQKTPPNESHKTNIILLKKSIDSYTVSDIETYLIPQVRTVINEVKENDDFIFTKVKQLELKENRRNLASFVFGKTILNQNKINDIYQSIINCNKTKPIDIKYVQAGIQFRPAGESKKRVIGRNYTPSRIERVNLYFNEDVSSDVLEYLDKDGNVYEITKDKLQKTIRTLVGINQLDASDLYDYVIKNQKESKVSSQVIFVHKIRLNSKESFLTSAYFNEKITPTNTLSMYLTNDEEEAKILTLYFSSILYLIQFIIYDKKTTPGYLEIGEADMEYIYIPDIKKCSTKEIQETLTYFESNKNNHLPSIKSQLENRCPERIKLDKSILKLLNIRMSTNKLCELYDTILKEILIAT